LASRLTRIVELDEGVLKTSTECKSVS